MIITIDGPVASGKSSIARNLAIKKGYYYLNSGFLYRAIAYILLNNFKYSSLDLSHPKIDHLDEIFFSLKYEFTNGKTFIWYNGEDLSLFLKSPEIDDAASRVSQVGLVRNLLLPLQKSLAENYNLVVEGRDIGSVVFPEADYKFFLTADILVRSFRWRMDQLRKNIKVSPEEALSYVSNRDRRDIERDIDPLVVPKDAIIIDSSTRSIDEVVEALCEIIK